MTAEEHLLDLVRIRSVSSASNRDVVDYARAVLERSGWSTRESVYRDEQEREKVNLLAAPPAQDVWAPAAELALVCHTDTVPFSPEWTRALKPFTDGEFLYGCGACDVKGFLACLLEAAGLRGVDWAAGLRIVLTADEEVGCVGAKHLLSTDVLRATRMVVGEPTSLRVARAGKGYCLAEVVVSGVEAHAAHPDQGASAIYAASRMIARIEELSARLQSQTDELFTPPFTSLNVGRIEGGTAKNIVPGECRFLVEWRPIPSLASWFVPDELRRFASELETRDSRIRCALHVLREQPGFETNATASLVRSLVEASGQDATSIPFGSEASVLSSMAAEVVVFGPGDMRTAHSDRERVPLVELRKAVSILSRLMQR